MKNEKNVRPFMKNEKNVRPWKMVVAEGCKGKKSDGPGVV